MPHRVGGIRIQMVCYGMNHDVVCERLLLLNQL